MMNLYPMLGMGSTGMGAGASPMVSPAMMAAMQGGMGGPMGGGAGVSPMSALIQHAPMPNGALGAPQAPVAGPPQPQTMQGATQGMPSMMQLLAAMKGGQTGVGLGQGSANGINNLLNGFSWGGLPGSGVLNGLSAQAAGNVASGAAGL